MSTHDITIETVEGGRHYYGQAIGIILYDILIPRIPGDVGNASTFDFPVRLKYVEGLDPIWIMKRHPDRCALPLLIKAAQELEIEGVRAITTGHGFTAVFQKELADAVSIPVFTSSLIQVPMVHEMLGSNQKVGIITADSEALGDEHLSAAGIDKSIPLIIAGIQDGVEWRRCRKELKMDPQKLENEVIQVAKRLVSENRNIGAIVLECTQLPSFAFSIQREIDLPVFDIYTLTNMVYNVIFRRALKRHRPRQFFDNGRFL